MAGIIKNLTGNYGFTQAEVASLNGKVALVTGGTNGVGPSYVRTLYTHSVKVYVLSHDSETGRKGVEYIKTGIQY